MAAFIALAGCQSPAVRSPTATALPLPSPIPALATVTPQASATPWLPDPLTEATQPIVLEPPEAQPTATLPIPPVNLPLESLLFLEPGPGSQVTSPFQIIGYGGPSFRERVQIRLYGEDGRLLDEGIAILLVYPGNSGRFLSELSFDIPDVAQVGRLEAEIYDRRYGRLSHMVNQELILLSIGSPRVRPSLHGPEQLAILSPREGRLVRDNPLTIQGAGWIQHAGPLHLEIHDRSGQVIASQLVEMDSEKPGQIGTFEAELGYELPFSQFVRIVVYEPRQDGSGFVHYSSIEVYLQR